MRKIAVIFGFLFAFMSQAQTFLDRSNVWSYATIGTYDENRTGNAVACDFRFVKYYINGETIINGRTYKNICSDVISYITKPHHMFSQNDDNYHTSSGNYMISLREQDNKIYVDADTYINSFTQNLMLGAEFVDYVLTKVDNEYVLYDFNVEKSDSILPNIGNIYSLIYPSYWFHSMDQFISDAIYRNSYLNLFYRDGKLEYKSPDFYPDPFFPEEIADGIEEIVKIEKLKTERAVFNLQGQRINGLQKGLNIVDGKKVWVK